MIKVRIWQKGDTLNDVFYWEFPLSEGQTASTVTIYPTDIVNLYTGLKDKNGVEIYAGDIIAMPTEEVIPICDDGSGPTEYYNELLTAEFSEGCVRFTNKENWLNYKPTYKLSLTKEQIQDEYCDWSEVEIIGNEYEPDEGE